MGLLLCLGGVAGVLTWREFPRQLTVHQLLTENRQLRSTLSNLSRSEQLGYAKVVSQEVRGDRKFTQLLLVQTDPDDPSRRLAEHTYQIEGDVAHFDALIVKFEANLVEAGEERALVLWRRVYGEHQRPSEGFPINVPGEIPRRYAKLFQGLKDKESALFWNAVWELAHNPEALKQYGVHATYGSAVYTQMRPGVIYAFKAMPTGQVYPEIYPDL